MTRNIIPEPTSKQTEKLYNLMEEYNKIQPTYIEPQQIVYRFNQTDGTFIGGLVCEKTAEYFWIDTFIIKEGYRNKGYGSYILKLIEQEARQQGCTIIGCLTTNYQAPKFYSKHGYSVIYTMQINDQPQKKVTNIYRF